MLEPSSFIYCVTKNRPSSLLPQGLARVLVRLDDDLSTTSHYTQQQLFQKHPKTTFHAFSFNKVKDGNHIPIVFKRTSLISIIHLHRLRE